MGNISLGEAELIAIFLETLLYGNFFTLFWITLWLLFKRQTESKHNRSLIAALIFMFILITAHVTIDFIRIIDAFIFHLDPASGGPIGYYSQLSHPLYVAKNVLYATLTLTGDMVMAWRCYIVYRRSYLVVIVPAVLLLSSALCGYAACWSVSRASVGSTIFVSSSKKWITPFFILTLSTNSYCTGFIVYRIWGSIRSLGPRKRGSRSLMPVLMAVVESGALYATALLATLISYLSGSNGQYAALDVVTPIVGIVFSLIIIQIDAYASGRAINSTNVATSWRSVQRPTEASPNYPMQPVDITVTTHRAIHVDHTQSRPSISDISSKDLAPL